ncbi:DUF350 domain-containing protein [Pseudooceanicola sp. 216_PA32_1]|uniref:DUF350 domain-containing protein n=1 Tax=Pseudooceanicola pacificus TaxID=2676438 RepID=A0A844WBK7_9RHOB|nr:DUF350 domain-containing protein [Pseudooceanicola pacificus]MWB76680.1 DUF350 domain-containing protein [Pseudooceanicola pacificus]
MDPFATIVLAEFVGTIFYTFIGVGLLFLVWKLIDWVTPFPVVKEIEEDNNIALAVLIGSVFIAIAIIIAAVILS